MIRLTEPVCLLRRARMNLNIPLILPTRFHVFKVTSQSMPRRSISRTRQCCLSRSMTDQVFQSKDPVDRHLQSRV
jgi:hypothetical protein